MKKSSSKQDTISRIDTWAVGFAQRNFIFLARFSLFLIYFWFGFLKAIDISPASPLAEGLTAKTIGADMFGPAFFILALFECLIGILFLFPRATKLAIVLMLAHMAMVSSPLVLMPADAWQSFLVPTLEGQYIIKNIALIAVATTLLAHSGSHRTNLQK
jgi:uncharacterized membrane protein YkgB